MTIADSISTQATDFINSCISQIKTAAEQLKELHSLFADDDDRLEAAQKYVDQQTDSLPDDAEPLDFDVQEFADELYEVANDIANSLLRDATNELKSRVDNACEALYQNATWTSFAEDFIAALLDEAEILDEERRLDEH